MRVLVIDPNAVRAGELSKAAALAACGPAVTVLAPRAWRENYRRQVAPAAWSGNYRLVRGPALGKPPNRALFLAGLAEALRPAPDIVLALSDENFWLTGQALMMQRLLAPRALFVCHSWRNLCFDRRWHPQPSLALYAADTWLERRVFARSAAIIARNRAAAGVLRRRGFRGRVVYIPWGVDTGHFCPAAPPPEPRAYTVGFVGRFSPEKGLDTLLAASGRMAAPHRLVLVGDGPLAGAVRAMAARCEPGRVEIAPVVDHADMPALYRRMDALVLPARPAGFDLEQFGRVLVEAMACGVAVAGSDAGAIPDVVGNAGLIFPAGEAAALASALDRLAAPGPRAELAAAGLQRARERFSWAAWALATANLLETLAAGRAPGPPLEVW